MKYLAWHLGLGDAIAFADLAVKLADGERMIVPCYAHNEVSVRTFFANHPNIDVRRVTDKDERDFGSQEIIRLGHYSGIPRMEGEDLIEWVYRTAGLLPDDRFDDRLVELACAQSVQLPIPRPPMNVVLVHDDDARGFKIDRGLPDNGTGVLRVRPYDDAPPTILSWSYLITTQPEIHCIDSAFLHLVENMSVSTGTKLVYHKYARPGSEAYRTLRHNWTVIE